MKPTSPPAGKTSPPRYITADGYQSLRDELQYLWKEKRPEVTQSVREAAAQGDRSENAEYIYGKKQLREIDRRIRFLTKRLEELTIVDRLPEDRSRAYFGAWVTVEEASTTGDEPQKHRYRIVGSDEFDLARGYLSINSPMARALLGKQSGDEISVRTPKGELEWIVITVAYSSV